MTLERPWMLLGLLVLAGAAGLWLVAERRRARYAVRYPNLDVLAGVAGPGSWTRYVPLALFGLALTSLLVALARPEAPRTLTDERATVILVLDTSRSMQSNDVRPTRLGAAQAAVRTFLDRAPSRLRVGLVVFAGDAQVATPPTRDHALVRQAVDDIGSYLVYGGTAIGDALRTAVELGKRTLDQQGQQGPNAAPAQKPSTRALSASTPAAPSERKRMETRAGAAGFPVYTVALGTPNGTVAAPPGFFNFGAYGSARRILVPPDPATLRAIAETTGGRFSEARTARTLEAAYSKLGSQLGRRTGRSEVTFLFVAV